MSDKATDRLIGQLVKVAMHTLHHDAMDDPITDWEESILAREFYAVLSESGLV